MALHAQVSQSFDKVHGHAVCCVCHSLVRDLRIIHDLCLLDIL